MSQHHRPLPQQSHARIFAEFDYLFKHRMRLNAAWNAQPNQRLSATGLFLNVHRSDRAWPGKQFGGRDGLRSSATPSADQRRPFIPLCGFRPDTKAGNLAWAGILLRMSAGDLR